MIKELKTLTLGKRIISQSSKPYIIAEIGVNHEGSIDLAKELIRLAKDGGADAAKFQTYKADTLASKNSPAYWDISKESTNSQHELFKKYDVFEEKDYIELYEYCQELEIEFASTPFDHSSVDFLNPLVPYFKIASADITNLPLLKYVSKYNKPVIISTGASNKDEIRLAIDFLNNCGVHDIAILHCILNYPTKNKNAHLRMISDLAKEFPNHLIGYSDHTLPDENMKSTIAAFLLGAVIIEKHFTNDKLLPGNDHYHAMDVKDLKKLNKLLDNFEEILGGKLEKESLQSEEISRLNARRSIVLRNDIRAGQIISEDNLICKRPGTGISPIHWDEVVGSKAKVSLKNDHILSWEDLNKKK